MPAPISGRAPVTLIRAEAAHVSGARRGPPLWPARASSDSAIPNRHGAPLSPTRVPTQVRTLERTAAAPIGGRDDVDVYAQFASVGAGPAAAFAEVRRVERWAARMLGDAARRPAAGALAEGRRVERWASRTLTDAANRGALAGLDALLASRFTDDAVKRILASAAAEHTVGIALSGPLVDAIARDITRYAVLERGAEVLLAGDGIEHGLARADAAALPERLADRLLADGVADQVVARLLDGPELERLVGQAVESPGMDRVVARVVDSPLLGVVVARLLETEELWFLVERVAQSPAVTDAIAQQGAGFADEVAGRARERSQHADAWLERTARRVLRRDAPPESLPEASPDRRGT